MNLFLLKPLLKALRGRSLTFSVIFASALMGASATALLRRSLSEIGLWLPVAWIGPMIIVGLLAKREEKLPLRPEFKRLVCYILVFGALTCSIGLWRYDLALKKKYPEPPAKELTILQRRGPRGK